MERKKAGTEDLKYLARTLARQAELSQQTVRSLAESSSTVSLTDEEFRGIGGLLNQSRVILTKYGRREVTEKFLILLAFIFYVSCVIALRAPRICKPATLHRTLQAQVRWMTDIIMSNKKVSTDSASNELGSVYVQYTRGKDMMTISFEYEYSGRKKSFNLYRKADEPLLSAFERLKLNLSKLSKPKKIKSEPAQEPQACTPSLSLGKNGSLFDPSGTKNADAWIEGAILEIDGNQFVVKRNEPQVVTMKLPSIIMKGFITVPYVDLANCDIRTCKFYWYRQISAHEREAIIKEDASSASKIEMAHQNYWLYLATGITYSPRWGDVAHNLKVLCEPSDGSRIGPKYACFSGRLVELGPPCCPFEKRQVFTTEKSAKEDEIRVVSYNILADLYADSEYSRNVLFAHCPAHALEIDYRRQLILKEIHGYYADIVCLQEVDRREFIKTYEPFFKLVSGHQGVFDTKGGQVAEGVATFFREDRFELIDSHKTVLSRLIDPHAEIERDSGLDEEIPREKGIGDDVEKSNDPIKGSSMPHPILDDLNSNAAKDLLSRMAIIREKIQNNTNLTKRFMGRHTVVQTNLLRLKNLERKYVIVANTHLYFAPDADHIRLLQGGVCVKYLEFIREYYKSLIETKLNDNKPDISIIFCGDMNSSPDCGLFKLLHEGKVDDKMPDWRSNESEAVEGLSLETTLRLSSAYQNIPYTNYTPGFNGCLDYIYYDVRSIDCESIVPMPDHEDVTATEGIPSDVFPSDHLALIANLRIKT